MGRSLYNQHYVESIISTTKRNLSPACPVRSKFATSAHAECFPSHLLLLSHIEIRAKIDDMRKIAIIGCGTSAMILSHALLNHGGFEVTVFSEKTANQWYEGPPTGTPFVAGA